MLYFEVITHLKRWLCSSLFAKR